jgi:hypothetical protein
MDGLPAWGLGEVLTHPERKNITLLRNTSHDLGI